ncbi:MAG: methylmalonyl Co-A mutase-associated GTPase MeaB [Anaerolineae bacterium]
MNDWLQALKEGRRRALAQAITQIEAEGEGAHATLAALYPLAGRAHHVGVTGAAGAGKSTLVNALARALRASGRTVGIVAVDPSSPFTGGALLGDRIRMRDLAGDPGVFIRSMASRGQLGGLARTTADVAVALDAAGFDVVIIETAGAGQGDVDIARAAHTTVVVEAPGMGDSVQAIKAGVLEIADVLALNKADHPDAAAAANALRAMLELGARDREGWQPPLIKTIAPEGAGVDALLDAIDAHREHLNHSGALAARERARVEAEITARLRAALLDRALAQLGRDGLADAVARVLARQEDPQSAALRLIASMGDDAAPGAPRRPGD